MSEGGLRRTGADDARSFRPAPTEPPIDRRTAPPSRLSPGPWLVLSLPILLLLVPPLVRGRIWFHEDLEFYFYGLRGQLHQSWLEGALRQWNPWTTCGLPLLADIQLAPFYPLSLFFYLLEPGPAFNLHFLSHFLLGSLLCYRWLRGLELSPWPATAGTLIYVWSGFFWAHLHHATFLAAGIWLPGMLWAWDRLLRIGPGRGWPALALMIGMAALAGGSPQILYYSLMTLGAYALFTTLRDIRPPTESDASIASTPGRSGPEIPARPEIDRDPNSPIATPDPVATRALMPGPSRRPLASLAAFALACACGLGIGAIELGPFYLAGLEKYREALPPLEFSSSFALSPLALARLLVPNVFGNDFYALEGRGYLGPGTYWESWCYLGILTLPLAAMAMARRGRRGFFTGLFWISLVGSLGMTGGLHVLLATLVPLYARFRAPSRLLMLTGLAAAALAGYTLEALRRRRSGPGPADGGDRLAPRLKTAAKFSLVLGLELWAICGLALFMRSEPLHPVTTAGWALALFNLLLAWGFLRRERAARLGPDATNGTGGDVDDAGLEGGDVLRPAARADGGGRSGIAVDPAAVAVMLLLVDLLPILWTYNHTVPAETATRVPAVVQTFRRTLEHDRILSDRSVAPYLLNGGLEFGYRNVRGYNPLNPERVVRFLQVADGSGLREGGISALIDRPTSSMLGLLAPALLVTRDPPESPWFLPIYHDPERHLRVLRSVFALPRAWLTGTLLVARDGEEALAQTASIAGQRPPPLVIEPGSESLGRVPKLSEKAVDGSTLTWKVDRTDEVSIEVDATGPVGLVLADTWAPGWEATVNGTPTPVFPAYHALRAVLLPGPGRHEVVFRYHTPGLAAGAVTSGLCALAVAAAWLLARVRSTAR